VRLGLLECDHVDERFAGIDGDYADMFAALLPWADLVPYDVIDDQHPSSPDECDGWVVTGSRYSVYDAMPWLDRLHGFVREVRASERPFLGICFGHQLLAHAVGGRTAKADAGWGVGAHDTAFVEPIESARLLYLHQDQVVEVPDGGVVLAKTDHCPVAALQVDERMLGIQAHPEFTGEYLAALLHSREDRIGEDLVERALGSLDAPRDEAAIAGWVHRFLG
jgi:GMP synthase-like glutamine amidotransferase